MKIEYMGIIRKVGFFVIIGLYVLFIGTVLINLLSFVYNSPGDNLIIDKPIINDVSCYDSLYCEQACNNYMADENFNSCRYKCLTLKNCGEQ